MNKILLVFLLAIFLGIYYFPQKIESPIPQTNKESGSYWLMLHRRSNMEYLYFGEPGVAGSSLQIKAFNVKSGVLGQRPTPLPRLMGKDYWLIVDKMESSDNPETAPYFLQLDVPVTEDWPYGPVPYMECGGQCDWELPGYFGLHGVNGNLEKLSAENFGSSGCVRHTDEDITFLYNLLRLDEGDVRYYIEDV